jgi:uncharacterized membrane protein
MHEQRVGWIGVGAVLLVGALAFGLVVAALVLTVLTAAFVVTTMVLLSQAAPPVLRGGASPALRGRQRARLNAGTSRYSPADLGLPGPALSAVGPAAYRQRLLDVLKARFVRGEIALAEYEARVAQVIRNPSVTHLG